MGRLPRPILRLHLDLPGRCHELLSCPLPSREVALPCERGLGPQHDEGGDGGEVGGVGRGPRPRHNVCDAHKVWNGGLQGGAGMAARAFAGPVLAELEGTTRVTWQTVPDYAEAFV